MKKILAAILILLIPVTAAFAYDDLDDGDDFYSFSNITTGYGAVYYTNDALYSSIDLGFSFNFAGLDDTRSFGIGLGSRFDILFGVGNSRNYLGVDVLVGPFFTFSLTRAAKINLTVGPDFGFYTFGGRSEYYSLGPGADVSVVLTPPSLDFFSFAAGVVGSAKFPISSSVSDVCLSAIPYVAFNFNFTPTPYYYPYGALVIY
ncbi:MAG: hypothetical protein ACI4NM_08885 [Bullifex sp.]